MIETVFACCFVWVWIWVCHVKWWKRQRVTEVIFLWTLSLD